MKIQLGIARNLTLRDKSGMLNKSICFSHPPLDDEERLREELKDLIDDNPIEEDDDSGGEDSDGGHPKRKKSDDEDELDDRLEDEDYDLIEENLGVKVERVS